MSAMLPLACDSQPVAAPAVDPSFSGNDAEPRHDVRDSGAVGDGTHDDTDAFARALDALPISGGTLSVPEGVYLINPLRSIDIRDRERLTLALHPKAVLKAIPVVEGYSVVVKVVGSRNVRIVGGSVIGERPDHLGAGGEEGHGIALYGSTDVIIEDVYASECWGDGILISASWNKAGDECRNVTVRRCRSVNNRRQGLSITGCVGAAIQQCEFSGSNGTFPEAGIDLEPNGGGVLVRGVRIAHCRAVRNAGAGMMLVEGVTDVILEHNVLSQNGREGLFVLNSERFVVADNGIESNSAEGIRLVAARHAEIGSNAIVSNGRAFPDGYDNVLINDASCDNLIADNDFTALVPGVRIGPRFDINVASQDCRSNRLLANVVRKKGPAGGGILDLGSQTEITAPPEDAARRRNNRRRLGESKRRTPQTLIRAIRRR
jgi:polygalacturonase